jgi:hypothetical protein
MEQLDNRLFLVAIIGDGSYSKLACGENGLRRVIRGMFTTDNQLDDIAEGTIKQVIEELLEFKEGVAWSKIDFEDGQLEVIELTDC